MVISSNMYTDIVYPIKQLDVVKLKKKMELGTGNNAVVSPTVPSLIWFQLNYLICPPICSQTADLQ